MQRMIADEGAYSVGNVSRRLSISESTTRRLIETGELKAHRVRRLLRVFEADLQEYLAKNANQQQRGAA